MATFADFALLKAVPSYGGAEIVLARRARPTPIDRARPLPPVADPVHLALFGDAEAAEAARIIAVASSAAQTAHEQVARILEVGAHDGTLYATAVAVDGVDVAATVEHDRRRQAAPDVAFSLAVAQQLAQVALDLHERGDVWAEDDGTGLSALFPAGLRLDALVLRKDGRLAVRILAGAAADPARPTAFRAPELATHKPTVASDVFVAAQALRALLTGDAAAMSAPRFGPAAAQLGPLLAAALAKNPDERLGLFMLVERLGVELERVAGRTPAAAVAASFLKREYRALVPDDADDSSTTTPSLPRSAGKAPTVFWPAPKKKDAVAAPVAADTFDLDAGLTAELPLLPGGDDSSSAVGRVFDELEDDDEDFVTEPIARADLERAAAGITITERPAAHKRSEGTSESEPPWISMSEDFALVDGASPEAKGAPPPDIAELETGPTVEMRTLFDVDGDATDSGGAPVPKDKKPRG